MLCLIEIAVVSVNPVLLRKKVQIYRYSDVRGVYLYVDYFQFIWGGLIKKGGLLECQSSPETMKSILNYSVIKYQIH